MSTATAPSSQRVRRRSRRPARVLLNTKAVVGVHSSNTTAEDRTRNGNPIQVSFCLKRSPQPSTVFVHSSDLNRSVAPDILYSVDDLLLLRVNMGSWPLAACFKDYDYFVYRADSARPSLQLLRRPHPYFSRFDVGLLPRPDGHYTIAALNFTGTVNQFELHLFHSDTSTWSSSMLSADAPLEDFPVKLPGRHRTTTVITIGGEGGTMGWVDLWRGILLCDVLDPKLSLRSVPLPLPLEELGNPAQIRGIAFIRGKGCLNFVHLESTEVCLPEIDDETRLIATRVDDWVLTTWSNNKMSNSLEDWHKESVVQASNITINPAISRVLEDTGLLRGLRNNEAAEKCRHLQNLSVHQPCPCICGEDVIYLVAREQCLHPKAWILAVDMKNGGRLQSAAYFGIREYVGLDIIYCQSRISKYMNAAKYKNPANAPVGKNAEE